MAAPMGRVTPPSLLLSQKLDLDHVAFTTTRELPPHFETVQSGYAHVLLCRLFPNPINSWIICHTRSPEMQAKDYRVGEPTFLMNPDVQDFSDIRIRKQD